MTLNNINLFKLKQTNLLSNLFNTANLIILQNIMRVNMSEVLI
jgi:hypothetical protein